jgi:hypothetical protein
MSAPFEDVPLPLDGLPPEPPRQDAMFAVPRATPPATRRDDPETSYEAAASVRQQTETHQRILRLFTRRGPMTDVELAAAWQQADEGGFGYPPISPSGLRSRRAELTDQLGLLEHSGEYRRGPTGRRMRVWRIAP